MEGGHQKSLPALTVPSPAQFVLLHVNRFPNKLAPNVLNNILRNPPFYSFDSFLIVPLMPFISQPDSSRYLIIFIPFSNKGNAVFSNGSKSLPKNPSDCLILCN